MLGSSPDLIITALTIAAGFSLLVERAIELLKHAVDGSAEAQAKKQAIDAQITGNKRARESLEKFKKALDLFEKNTKNLKPLIDLGAEKYQAPLHDDQDDGDSKDTTEKDFEKTSSIALKRISSPLEADLMRSQLQIFYLLSAFGLGVVLAASLDLHLVTMLMSVQFAPGQTTIPPAQPLLLVLDEILTGLVIAGGSQPIHLLIKFLTSRKISSLELEKQTAFESKEAEAVAQLPAESKLADVELKRRSSGNQNPWVPVEYHGGVKPESLENRNRRKGNPNLIVYHHTAMSSKLGFQAVVDEFLISKQWSTGYHCVIMPDGAVKPFCRWDRVGNHASSRNNRSLGITFHGNFHVDKNDNFSNHDGRYGNRQPTNVQVSAGARVVALWVHLYDDIKLDFDSQIMPHRDVLAGHTVCPGSNFPYRQFEDQVRKYYEGWQGDSEASAQIAAFKHKPYIYV